MLNFPDTDLVDLLAFGWPIDYTSVGVPVPTFKNHSRGEVDSLHIQKFICKELSHTAMIGPFASSPFQPWL